ncbi:MAG: energy transducer TonB [Candidatus Omnitrophica bacterium]|nr:energy transducer TonB [Candidatus Omnitrophota bacterium]
MFRDKTLSIAFLISVSWHVFFMLCFTVVVLPAGFPMHRISNVSFLGPILEKTAFELMLEKKSRFEQDPSYRDIMNLSDVSLSGNEVGFDKLKFIEPSLKPATDNETMSANDLFGTFKITPPFIEAAKEPMEPGEAQEGAVYKSEEDLAIEGPLAQSEILFKPDAPAITKRIEEGQESFTVELRFKASAAGNVEEAVLLVSSGYADVDMAAINYIKGFKFSAPSSEDANVGWNKVRLRLKSK